MPHHLESLEGIGVRFPDTAFFAGNVDLLLHCVHSVQIGQQQSAPVPITHDDAIPLRIQLIGRIHRFRPAQHIHTVFQLLQFVSPHGRESRIPGPGRHRILYDLPGNTPDALIRLDMSEFMEKHSVSRIVGSPPGYVGYDEAGQLTEKIRRKPYAVVLFDEIEKAHPDVLNVLLQILDDGEITDAHGRKVNFENTIIVMTSNAGSATKEGTVGFGRTANEQDADRAMKALQQFLRPEFINRVDAVITFNRLSEENFGVIARIMLGELVTSLKDKGIAFTYDDALVTWLTGKSFSRTYGARNLRRTIQKELEDPMATKIIDSYESPITQIRATVEDDKVQLYGM